MDGPLNRDAKDWEGPTGSLDPHHGIYQELSEGPAEPHVPLWKYSLQLTASPSYRVLIIISFDPQDNPEYRLMGYY